MPATTAFTLAPSRAAHASSAIVPRATPATTPAPAANPTATPTGTQRRCPRAAARSANRPVKTQSTPDRHAHELRQVRRIRAGERQTRHIAGGERQGQQQQG